MIQQYGTPGEHGRGVRKTIQNKPVFPLVARRRRPECCGDRSGGNDKHHRWETKVERGEVPNNHYLLEECALVLSLSFGTDSKSM